MWYGDWGIYRIRSPWEVLQLFLQEPDYCSVSAGSQHPVFIFICPLSAASIAVTDSGVAINKKFFLSVFLSFFLSFPQANLRCCNIGPFRSVRVAITLCVKPKLHFWALYLFKHCKISLPFAIKKRWIICTLPELYRLFFKTQAHARFMGTYNKFHAYIFQNGLYLQNKTFVFFFPGL